VVLAIRDLAYRLITVTGTKTVKPPRKCDITDAITVCTTENLSPLSYVVPCVKKKAGDRIKNDQIKSNTIPHTYTCSYYTNRHFELTTKYKVNVMSN